MLYRYVNITDLKLIMNDLLYLKDDQIKDFIEKIFYAYRETYSDPKKILKKHSFGTAHHKAIHLIEKYNGLTISNLLNNSFFRNGLFKSWFIALCSSFTSIQLYFFIPIASYRYLEEHLGFFGQLEIFLKLSICFTFRLA